MGTLLTPRNLIIAFLVILGVSGFVEALPYAHESLRGLLIDAALLLLIVALSVVFARVYAARRRR